MKTLIGIMLIVLGTITWCLARVADDENDKNDELQEEKEDNEEE